MGESLRVLHRKHYPAEIFGYPVENKLEIASNFRENCMCPFIRERCPKLSRLIDYPMGVCSVWWPDNNPIAICPKRFLQDNTIFIEAANHVFGNTNNVLLFNEVKLENVGTFDFVLVKHKPISNIIEDFCVVEFQTCSTTSTGKLVNAIKDYMKGEDIINNSYSFGMNTYNDIKLSFIQMLIKGQVFEAWGKKIVWAVQHFLYENFVNRFNLIDMHFDQNDANVFFVCNLDYSSEDEYKIVIERTQSSTIENLIKAFQGASLAPNVDEFIRILQSKLVLELGMRIL